MHEPDKMPVRLVAFLQRMHPGSTVNVDSYEPILGGFSRLTARFRSEIDGVEQPMVIRGDPPPETSIGDTDRGREWLTMRALHDAGVLLPQPLYFDPEGDQLGTKAIVMTFVDGEPLLHLAARSDEAQLDVLSAAMGDLAIAIHGADVAPLEHLEMPSDWDEYIDGCIERWRELERTYPQADPFIRYLASWLDDNRPPPAPLGLVHGDFQSTNVLVKENGSFVALDWELTHIGDPREDLGWCTWNEVIQPPGLIERDEAAFCRRYAKLSGLGDEIVNPSTVAYFSVLSAIGACQVALPTLGAFARGLNNSLVTGYVLGYVSTFHEQFVEVTKAIEAAELEKVVRA